MGFNELYRKHLRNYLIEAKEDKLIPFIQNVFLKASNVTYNDLDDEKKVKLQGFINDKLKWYKDAIAKISSNEVYQVWLIRMIITGKLILPEDSEKVIELFKKFDKIKLRSDVDKAKKDIQKYNSVGELYDFVRSFNKAKVDDDSISYGENELLFTHLRKFDVIKISDYEDGKPLLQDSNWCVQHESRFKRYGAPYYLIVLNDGKRIERLALLHFNSKQFKDINDDAIDSNVEFYDDLVDICKEINKKENGNKPLVGGDFGIIFYYSLPDSERVKAFINDIVDDEDISRDDKVKMLNYDAEEIVREAYDIGHIVESILDGNLYRRDAIRFIRDKIDIGIPFISGNNIAEELTDSLYDIVRNYNDLSYSYDLFSSIVENFTAHEITDEIKEALLKDEEATRFINEKIGDNFFHSLYFDYDEMNFLSKVEHSGTAIGYFITDSEEMNQYLDQLYCDELESEFENVLLDNLRKVKDMISIDDDDDDDELEA